MMMSTVIASWSFAFIVAIGGLINQVLQHNHDYNDKQYKSYEDAYKFQYTLAIIALIIGLLPFIKLVFWG